MKSTTVFYIVIYSLCLLQAFDTYIYATAIVLLAYVHLIILTKKKADCSAPRCSSNVGLFHNKSCSNLRNNITCKVE